MISPNSITIYPAPKRYKDHFIYCGRRYFQTDTKCLISQYGKYGFLPPIDRGGYEIISTKEFKQAKFLFDIEKANYEKYLNGNLNEEGKKQLTFSF